MKTQPLRLTVTKRKFHGKANHEIFSSYAKMHKILEVIESDQQKALKIGVNGKKIHFFL